MHEDDEDEVGRSLVGHRMRREQHAVGVAWCPVLAAQYRREGLLVSWQWHAWPTGIEPERHPVRPRPTGRNEPVHFIARQLDRRAGVRILPAVAAGGFQTSSEVIERAHGHS